ncbi:hypothetical protein CANARDRAFT_28974 [[Candida] arabinofermentans NRRL YB-2248]|uniref:High osmolarity signaling protein SHO1 n=1 Tax=[Candida] arabinofermentans NRRL YB-2248 TaxID=983967 RepID=A0A1E4SZF4_9ASCO|nr:hypothetical protein CANARDRAFT_28974 [[Candida] arabinofermentans NRRL YB-2248]
MSTSSPIKLFNPFALGSFVIASIAWIIAFAGSIATRENLSYYPKFSWWGLVYQLILLIIVAIFYTTKSFHQHRLFLNCAIAISFIYNSNSTNNLIYLSTSSSGAASAGFIILCMIDLVWLFYFGSEPNSPVIAYIDSFGNGDNIMMVQNNKRASMNNQSMKFKNSNQPSIPVHQQPSAANTPNINPFENDYGSQLKGLENASTVNQNHSSQANLVLDDDYPIKVQGIYDYVASPDDINELSFKKGEVFRVKDNNGNWWQGKNSLGEIGMCPSNYLEIIS